MKLPDAALSRSRSTFRPKRFISKLHPWQSSSSSSIDRVQSGETDETLPAYITRRKKPEREQRNGTGDKSERETATSAAPPPCSLFFEWKHLEGNTNAPSSLRSAERVQSPHSAIAVGPHRLGEQRVDATKRRKEVPTASGGRGESFIHSPQRSIHSNEKHTHTSTAVGLTSKQPAKAVYDIQGQRQFGCQKKLSLGQERTSLNTSSQPTLNGWSRNSRLVERSQPFYRNICDHRHRQQSRLLNKSGAALRSVLQSCTSGSQSVSNRESMVNGCPSGLHGQRHWAHPQMRITYQSRTTDPIPRLSDKA
ncbi:unnamed protein product [Soboliphyme baturini]|uniref:Uncharacterized protein n=1 Tax=Soboliphyme baturini TaxID=241478 RepID=A0A183J0Z8_9BILA|nr:unnamed protein product [Soboliphyme baturini]